MTKCSVNLLCASRYNTHASWSIRCIRNIRTTGCIKLPIASFRDIPCQVIVVAIPLKTRHSLRNILAADNPRGHADRRMAGSIRFI